MLIIGKRYRNGFGEVVVIVERLDSDLYLDDRGTEYYPDGKQCSIRLINPYLSLGGTNLDIFPFELK